MHRDALKDWFTVRYPEAKVEDSNDFPVVFLDKENLFKVAEEVKNHTDTHFDSLFCLTAVDKLSSIEVVYFLSSSVLHHSVMLKVVLTDREHPEVDSVLPLWESAELFECEIFDLFGVHFNNHACRRLFLSDDWIGYPLRKDYKDDVNVIPI